MAEASWQRRFDLPPNRLWPVLSDTPRFNEALGTPKFQVEEIPQSDGTVLRLARARMGRLKLEWEERPYQWVEGRRWSQSRKFRSGPFRILGASLVLEPEGGGFPAIIGDGAEVTAGPSEGDVQIALENRAASERTFIVESRDWVRDTLTAHRVATLQTFRDLFSTEALASGDSIGVSQVVLMFTDLRGSTALYERMGDSAAFSLVRAHFAFLAEMVRNSNGAIVKTIGDAVMAAFSDPADAVAAALAVQREVAGFNERQGSEAIVIKIGLHAGPCIAVSLNDRLDYFGSTANMAARLEGQSAGGDIVISATLAADPRVAAILEPFALTEEAAVLKGFDKPTAFVRLAAQGQDTDSHPVRDLAAGT